MILAWFSFPIKCNFSQTAAPFGLDMQRITTVRYLQYKSHYDMKRVWKYAFTNMPYISVLSLLWFFKFSNFPMFLKDSIMDHYKCNALFSGNRSTAQTGDLFYLEILVRCLHGYHDQDATLVLPPGCFSEMPAGPFYANSRRSRHSTSWFFSFFRWSTIKRIPENVSFILHFVFLIEPFQMCWVLQWKNMLWHKNIGNRENVVCEIHISSHLRKHASTFVLEVFGS